MKKDTGMFKRNLQRIAAIATVIMPAVISVGAHADDCGQPPMSQPSVIDGATATSETLRISRDAVLSYSDNVDAWLACMDRRIASLSPFLTKEQRTRWQEDSAKLHNERRDLQVKLNEEIRKFRRTQANG